MRSIKLNRVVDTVTFRSGKKRMKLFVDLDPRVATASLMEAGGQITQVQKALEARTADTDMVQAAVLRFAGAIFGPKQAAELLAFCVDAETTLVAVSEYFQSKLVKKIFRAQRRVARK